MTTAAILNTAAAEAIGRNLRWVDAGGASLAGTLIAGRTTPPSSSTDGLDVEGSLVAYLALDLHARAGRPACVATYTGAASTGEEIGIAIDMGEVNYTVGDDALPATALGALTGLAASVNASAFALTASIENSALVIRSDDGRQHVYGDNGADIEPALAVEASYVDADVWFLMEGSDVWRLRPDLVGECVRSVTQNTMVRLPTAGVRRVAVQARASDGPWTWRLALAEAA